jgi:hypothetical protein
MTKTIYVAALAVSLALCGSAMAQESSYAFKVQNASGGAASVTMDGKSVCSLAAGGTCTVSIKDADQHAYAFALAGGAPMSFQPGNLEMVDVCKLDAKGAHCVDPMGTATN